MKQPNSEEHLPMRIWLDVQGTLDQSDWTHPFEMNFEMPWEYCPTQRHLPIGSMHPPAISKD